MLTDAREAALKIIYRALEEGGYSNVLLDHSISSGKYSPEDRALITVLVYGVLENKIYLDWIINRYSKIKEDKIDPWVYNILRLSVFQIKFLDRVPGFAAVNEGVKLSKKYGGKSSAGFVNGMLRNIIRNPGKAEIPPRGKNPEKFISLKYSHPLWMVEDWVRAFGPDFTEELCKANNRRPDLVLRTNTLRITREELINRLKDEGVNARPGRYSGVSVIVGDGFFPGESRAFREGLFYVQDESSMLAVEVLAPQKGQLMIDVCSAPGGKCTYAAQIMGDEGRIIARDINEKKRGIIEENCARMGTKSVEVQTFDARKLDKSLIGKADKVLVDVPCSGLGIIRRKPDIKWKKEREHYTALSKIQRKILENASRYLKPGGELVYSTCTIMPQENLEVASAFVKNNPQFAFEDITPRLPLELRSDSCKKGYLQLFPNVHGTDGFFICKVKKIK
jgi:16S rRNA (cytosine967-C5)-methyltransferase